MTAAIPGVTFEVAPPRRAPEPLRTDIAAFVGRTKRGPVGTPVRVEGWRHFERVFGGLWRAAYTPYALRGYFENGGQIAHVLRIGRPPFEPAHETWRVDEVDATVTPPVWAPGAPAHAGFRAARFRIVAASPGMWGNDLSCRIVYRRNGRGGLPGVDIDVNLRDEPGERLVGLPPDELEGAVAAMSELIRLEPVGLRPAIPAGATPGPFVKSWSVQLSRGAEPSFDLATYQAAVALLLDLPEPAVFAFPDLHRDLPSPVAQDTVIQGFAASATALLDRMAVIDLLPTVIDADGARSWLAGFGQDLALARSLAAYHPWLDMQDPLGSAAEPLRRVPPSGHVAGLISRIDRERGAYVTPANAELLDVVDAAHSLDAADEAAVRELGINMIRCFPGYGLRVWGGRMLRAGDAPPLFVAHRRLLHRLVRAIRRVARPLVFESNDPALWYSLARAATTVLLEAYRAGALKGTRPEEAFRVRCDETTTPPAEQEGGKVVCEVSFAPAEPMEFITIRIALDAEGQLEVAEP